MHAYRKYQISRSPRKHLAHVIIFVLIHNFILLLCTVRPPKVDYFAKAFTLLGSCDNFANGNDQSFVHSRQLMLGEAGCVNHFLHVFLDIGTAVYKLPLQNVMDDVMGRAETADWSL